MVLSDAAGVRRFVAQSWTGYLLAEGEPRARLTEEDPLDAAPPPQFRGAVSDDAAAATVAAMERGRAGIYHITDDEPARASQWLPALARALGAKPPIRVPVWLARILAGPAVIEIMTRASGASNAKARRELEWQPIYRTWRDGFLHGLR